MEERPNKKTLISKSPSMRALSDWSLYPTFSLKLFSPSTSRLSIVLHYSQARLTI